MKKVFTLCSELAFFLLVNLSLVLNASPALGDDTSANDPVYQPGTMFCAVNNMTIDQFKGKGPEELGEDLYLIYEKIPAMAKTKPSPTGSWAWRICIMNIMHDRFKQSLKGLIDTELLERDDFPRCSRRPAETFEAYVKDMLAHILEIKMQSIAVQMGQLDNIDLNFTCLVDCGAVAPLTLAELNGLLGIGRMIENIKNWFAIKEK
ncbi:MAG TPA: hypothetical protein PLP17_06320 [Oligoflexia bacterium]|nr:hypothetical protein [Oligoflexia bacterium]